ncbi:MAG: copper resistance protein B [Gammaproteobacteria bacterium]|nr:copper resistance protein B [Gammaproteobacteria bacterium]
MKIIVLSLLGLLSFQTAAQQAADAYYDPAAMAAARDNVRQMHGDDINSLIIGERLENQIRDGDSSLVWEAQGWIGYDLNKLWLKTEGDSDDESEFQALWSHAISPFWDFQTGWRHDFEGSNRDYAVIGLMGLAPYWFEVDAAAFISDEGDASARLEAEYDLRFTQRLILQPRMELNYAFSDDVEAGIGQGLHELNLGLRLRYEVKREFAPYLGVTWEKSFGDTADFLRTAGKDTSETTFVLGLRFWY